MENLIPKSFFDELIEQLSYGTTEDIINIQIDLGYDFHDLEEDIWNNTLKPGIIEKFRKEIKEKIGDKKYKIIDIPKFKVINGATKIILSVDFKFIYKK